MFRTSIFVESTTSPKQLGFSEWFNFNKTGAVVDGSNGILSVPNVTLGGPALEKDSLISAATLTTLNGQKAALFTGTQSLLMTNPVAGAIGCLFFVIQPTTTISAATSPYQGLWRTEDPDFNIRFGATTGTLTNEVITLLTDDGGLSRVSYTSASGTLDTAQTYFVYLNWNGTSYDIYLNGVQVNNATVGIAIKLIEDADFSSYSIGTGVGGASGFQGYLLEAGRSVEGLSTGELAELSKYIRQEWGL